MRWPTPLTSFGPTIGHTWIGDLAILASDDRANASEFLVLAELAAREAGRCLAAGPRRDAPVVKENGRDVRLEADRARRTPVTRRSH